MLTTDLILKLVTWIGGPLIVGLIIFFKGYGQGIRNTEEKQRAATDKLKSSVRGAEAKNQTLDWKRDQAINEVERPKSTLDLLEIWNKRWGSGKTGEGSDEK